MIKKSLPACAKILQVVFKFLDSWKNFIGNSQAGGVADENGLPARKTLLSTCKRVLSVDKNILSIGEGTGQTLFVRPKILPARHFQRAKGKGQGSLCDWFHKPPDFSSAAIIPLARA
jgi:hypothetical protein